VISRFTENNFPAMVESYVGKGIAILSGVHLEIHPSVLKDHSSYSSLLNSNSNRLKCFRTLLFKLGLDVEENLSEEIPQLSPIYFICPSFNEKESVSKFLISIDPNMIFKGTPTLQFFSCSNKIEHPNDDFIPVILSLPQDMAEIKSFDYRIYLCSLQTKQFGRHFMYAETTTSTQTILNEQFMLFKNLPNGTLFCASSQIKGSGRGGNVWISPQGCLMFSLQIEHKNYATLVHIQYLMALAVVDSIRSRPQYKDLDIKIKWPNDIYYQNDKIAGILVNSNYFENKFTLIIGVGINLYNMKPTTSINQILQEMKRSKPFIQTIGKEELLAWIINRFEGFYLIFEQKGFTFFESLYYSYWMHRNQIVQLSTDDEGIVDVLIDGITETGFLKAINTQTKQEYELFPDGNSFDIMKGLIKRKQ
jgi:biotin--protein ligase